MDRCFVHITVIWITITVIWITIDRHIHSVLTFHYAYFVAFFLLFLRLHVRMTCASFFYLVSEGIWRFLMQPPWDCLTRVLAVLGRAVFCFAGAGMVIGTFPCYVSRDAALQMLLDEDSMPPKAWQALGSTSDGKLWQDFIIYYARTEFAAEMVLGLVWLYFGLMPRSLMPYHVRAAAYGLFFVMCAVGYGEDALQGGNPFQPGGGAEIATNEFSSMFLPLGVIGVACFLGEWARVARIEKAHEDSAAKGALPANYRSCGLTTRTGSPGRFGSRT